MADESFHLTPLDIRRYDFGSALRGYDRARVDQFREQAANEVERLVKQCQALEGKAQGFHEQLRAFRERDKAINEALISAQQLRAEVREQAEREAQLILREARAEAERIVAGAANDARQVQGELEALVRQRRSYLSQLRTMVERQLSDIEAAEASAASMTPVRREAAPAAPAAAMEQPEWLDSVVKE
ncbi:MAG: DivIVA domain-containing protein [Gemmatimonadetes bacterium]|jgi:DivIVA domain-containing protein|nr:DivIVA domain-containing protein [Gemmatimonadota bacterium]MBP9107652.1 DivIVA domain-containing protein [Gemmatimonadaceae bacterium]MBK6456741.1 DivIVA domain-containing protein [Gemmatimonadota bacterium]MBK6842266.1 DivIVA domain-containing protein [Gemmatimonadota bacterium]MBK7835970.1 DivIVA domain-containing protein [Gemmatimonadota bacterium]